MHGLAVGMNATISHLSQTKKTLSHINDQLKDFQDQIAKRGEAYANHPQVIEQLNQIKYIQLVSYCHLTVNVYQTFHIKCFIVGKWVNHNWSH